MACGNFGNFNLTGDSTTFVLVDNDTYIPKPVMRLEMCDVSPDENGNAFELQFKNPIPIISNREYVIEADIFDAGFFNELNDKGQFAKNKTSIIPITDDVEIDIISDVSYVFPMRGSILLSDLRDQNKFIDGQEYQYSRDGLIYYGSTGVPITDMDSYHYGIYEWFRRDVENGGRFVSGRNKWHTIRTRFKTEDNTGKKFVKFAIYVETDSEFRLNTPLFINDFKYNGADILVQDKRKQDLKIQSNFDSSFDGGIQKLRIYDRALNPQEVLRNASVDNLEHRITKGGRIIHR